MRPPLLLLALALAGCGISPVVEALSPSAADRRIPVAVRHPAGEVWALEPDVLQREAVGRLRSMGCAGVRGEGRVPIPKPFRDGAFATGTGHPRRAIAGERGRAAARLSDGRGGLLHEGVRVEGLSSSLTEARVAEAPLRPLEG